MYCRRCGFCSCEWFQMLLATWPRSQPFRCPPPGTWSAPCRSCSPCRTGYSSSAPCASARNPHTAPRRACAMWETPSLGGRCEVSPQSKNAHIGEGGREGGRDARMAVSERESVCVRTGVGGREGDREREGDQQQRGFAKSSERITKVLASASEWCSLKKNRGKLTIPCDVPPDGFPPACMAPSVHPAWRGKQRLSQVGLIQHSPGGQPRE